jgi:hypothetical protein
MNMQPMLFEDFVPGTEIGTHVATYDQAMVGHWRSIFGQSQPPDAENAGIAIALMMRSYMGVTPRPPGNVHARQGLRVTSLPHPGEQVRTVVSCAGKEIKRERRYVEFSVRASGARERPLYDGRLTLVWAG